MTLNKREILGNLSNIGDKLRSRPSNFLEVDGKTDIAAAEVRLNRLGKCIQIGSALILNYADGMDNKEVDEYIHQFKRYFRECNDAFQK
jgi:hypothetical protein